MDSAPVAQAPAAATASPGPAGTGSSRAPEGYKFVKIRKADGTIATVKRKLSPGEGVTSPPSEGIPAVTGVASPPGGTPQFKIVTVRKADGTLVKVRRPVTKQSDVEKQEQMVSEDAAPQNVEPSGTAANAKSPAQKSDAASATSSPVGIKADPPVANASDGSKKTPEIAPASSDVTDKPKSNDDSSDPKTQERELADALAEQATYNRAKRTHRFKSSLLKGFGMAVGSALPSLEIAHDFEDGDELLSDDDDDYSVDDMDDRHEGHDGGDEHDISEGLHARNEVDGGTAHEAANSASGTHVTFDAGTAMGGLAGAAAANAAAQPPPPPPAARAAQNGGTTKSDPEKEKHTYKITARELADLEKATAEKVSEKKLSRHWANVTFYLMASLSIVLPSLFILLSGFIGGMNGKLVSSNWSKMENPIKVAISAWPIVFAAVVAQCFKAYATFKVERGIKLMELEQLVGSSSFASAIKQPVLLRRLDLLTLVLFAIWCLSPIGSQALQRVYAMDRKPVNTTASVLMAPNYGPNRMFSVENGDFSADPEYPELLQLISAYYISALAPIPSGSKYFTDGYLHPVMFTPDKMNKADQEDDDETYLSWPVAAYGSNLAYPYTRLDTTEADFANTKAAAAKPKYEELTFRVQYSYFNFTCGPWQNKTQEEVTYDIYSFSDSGTFGLTFSSSSETSTDYTGIRLASANAAKTENRTSGHPSKNQTKPWEDPEFPYSYIECGFDQVFVEASVRCVTDTTTLLPDCDQQGDATPIPAENTKGMETKVTDFSWAFVGAGNPGVVGDSPTTLSEFYLLTGWSMSGEAMSNDGVVLSATTTSEELSYRFGYLFNTFLGLGYCPECVNVYIDADAETREQVAGLYHAINANLGFGNDLVYVVRPLWLAIFTVCTGILFLCGIAGVVVEAMTVAPDVLGYVSTVARNSRYLQLPKTSSAMSGGERAKTVGGVKVMMQDVKGNADVGKIALGLKHEQAKRLVPGRLYR